MLYWNQNSNALLTSKFINGHTQLFSSLDNFIMFEALTYQQNLVFLHVACSGVVLWRAKPRHSVVFSPVCTEVLLFDDGVWQAKLCLSCCFPGIDGVSFVCDGVWRGVWLSLADCKGMARYTRNLLSQVLTECTINRVTTAGNNPSSPFSSSG